MTSSHIELETANGHIRGRAGPVRQFLGIPYAKPPVGELRWRPPAEMPSWPGVRDATGFGPDSFQEHDPQLRGSGLSEDCLYLNVWSPAEPSHDGLPVMVWIHGNGYTRGSGSHCTYDGEALAAQGVVIVTINYRLGVAGFLAHPELTAESEHGSSGNYGLLDQIAALRWVQRNIEAFGGAPSRVTVFGQSAGATCSHLLMSSPLARGLFSQIILHSPGSMRPMAELCVAEQGGAKIGASLAQLRDLPISRLWPTASKLVPPVRRLASPRGLGPIVDGWVIQGDDISNYRQGRVTAMPMMIGITENEGRRLTERMPTRSAASVRQHLTASFGSLDRVPQPYLPADDASAPSCLDRAVGDTQFGYGANSIAHEMARRDAPAYRYLFAYPIPGCDLPPTHDDELPFVFGTLRAGNLWRGSIADNELSSHDWELSRAMMESWASFARDGAPCSQSIPTWPQSRRDEVMVLSAAPHVRQLLPSDGLRSLQDYFGH